ncbi:zinc finger protein Helios isoform X1 [Osmerus mordax]|uniref:zinc finger protein Helios isoform X1 n=2 Tax=Osmerus mordax TaxID=8014 RepID=UPI00350FCFAC
MQPIRIIIVNGNGDCPPRKENSRMSVDLSANTPNGQEPQGPKSPSEVTIKQEEGTGDEADGKSTAPEDMTHSGEEGSGLEEPMIDSPNNLQDGVSGSDGVSDADNRLQNGDRPFQCNQCGVSFTQKGNLLRHIKLHTGEKPFKCPFCSYACRRRDALSGHLRTHSVGKPHKCNYCGRSYKQRTSLEEHKERCHSYLQSVGMDPTSNSGPYPGEATKEHRPPAEASVMATFDRPPVIERLQSNVGKRKSSNPQKFVGEKMVRYSYPELNYEMGMKYEKEAEMMQAHMMDQAINNAISYLGADSIRPLVHHPRPHPHPGTPLSMAEVVPMVNPLFSHVYSTMGPRMERPSSRDVPHIPVPLPPPDYPPSSNGPVSLSRPKHPPAVRGESPSNSGLDSADSARSSPQERLGYHANLPHPRSRPSPVYGREERRAAEAGLTPEVLRGGGERPVSQDGVRVIGRQGQEVRVFQCEHCRILFLDHVMYTIHMGCHGYRDPLECNICGHRSKDHYEFSSHIVRGEHTFR